MSRITICLVILLAFAYGPQSVIAESPTPTISLHFTKILEIPAVKSGANPPTIPVSWLAWNPAASNFAAVYEFGDQKNPIHILDGQTGSTIQDVDSLESVLNSRFVWSPDGTRIAASLPDNLIKIWTLNGNAPVVVIHTAGFESYPIYWNPDGRKLISVRYVYTDATLTDGNFVMSIWDTQSGKLLSAHPQMALGAWRPDGKKLVVLSGDLYNQVLQIVNADTFKLLFTFPNMPDYENAGITNYVLWTRDSREVITASYQKDINELGKLWNWDAQTGQVTEHFEQPYAFLDGEEVSPDRMALNGTGTLLAVADGNAVLFWDVPSGKILDSLMTGDIITAQTDDDIHSISWNHSQDILLLARASGTIEEWNIQRESHSR